MGDEELIEMLNGIVRKEKNGRHYGNQMSYYYNDDDHELPTNAVHTDDRNSENNRMPAEYHISSNEQIVMNSDEFIPQHMRDFFNVEDEGSEDEDEFEYLPRRTMRSSNNRDRKLQNSQDFRYQKFSDSVHTKPKLMKKLTKKKDRVSKEEAAPNYLRSVRNSSEKSNSSVPSNGISSSVKVNAAAPSVTETDQELHIADLEGKLSTLKLRVQGQQNTVRALEAQVSDLSAEVEVKTKDIESLNKKLRLAEASKTTSAASAVKLGERPGNKYEDIVKKLKMSNGSLQERLSEEQGKVKRAEERTREIRDYADRVKMQASELEGKNQEQAALIEEMQGKLGKYRRESRDFHSKASVWIANCDEKDSEIRILKDKMQSLETKMKEIIAEKERYKANNHKTRTELVAAVDKLSQLRLEVNVLKEKERSKKSLEKYNATSNSSCGGVSNVRKSSAEVPLKPKQNSDFDWSSFSAPDPVTHRAPKRVQRRVQLRVDQQVSSKRSSQDDSALPSKTAPTSTSTSVTEAAPTNWALSDSESNKSSFAELEQDVYTLMKSMNKTEKNNYVSGRAKNMRTSRDLDQSGISLRSNTTSSSARQRFDKLSQIYKRVTGESTSAAFNDDSSSDDSESV